MSLSDETERIRRLSTPERMAGYLARVAAFAAVGARLRKDGREDNTWTEEEAKEFDAAGDEIEPWADALSKDEHEVLYPIDLALSCLCRGEVLQRDLGDRAMEVLTCIVRELATDRGLQSPVRTISPGLWEQATALVKGGPL